MRSLCASTRFLRSANSAALGPRPARARTGSSARAAPLARHASAAAIIVATLRLIISLLCRSIRHHHRRRQHVVRYRRNAAVFAVVKVLDLGDHSLADDEAKAPGQAPGLCHVEAFGSP